jgi:hypothetical protein
MNGECTPGDDNEKIVPQQHTAAASVFLQGCRSGLGFEAPKRTRYYAASTRAKEWRTRVVEPLELEPLEWWSSRLGLRRLRQEDATAIGAYRALPEVARFPSWESFKSDDTGAVWGSESLLALLRREWEAKNRLKPVGPVGISQLVASAVP